MITETTNRSSTRTFMGEGNRLCIAHLPVLLCLFTLLHIARKGALVEFDFHYYAFVFFSHPSPSLDLTVQAGQSDSETHQKVLIRVFPRLSTTKNVVGSSSDVKTPQENTP